jgi:hypothetical protein
VEGQVRSNFSKSGAYRNRFYVDQTTTALSLYAIPTGSYPEIAWVLPQISGQIASTQPIQGAGSATATVAGGLGAAATVTGAGDITRAVGQLIISMVAALVGNGTITSAELQGFLDGDSGNLTGAGSLTAELAALAWMSAALKGSGSITSAAPYASGNMSADILSYGALTPEGIRDTVWNAIAANFVNVGSMGELLNSAGAAADPLLGVVEGSLTLRDVQRIVLAALAGGRVGLGGATENYLSQDGTVSRITFSPDAQGNGVPTVDAT